MKASRQIAGFAVFRFDTEENEGDGEDEVLYWLVCTTRLHMHLN